MRNFVKLIAVSSLVFASAAQARADFTLFNTGVDADGNQLSAGALDPHWLIVAGPGIPSSSAAKPVVVNNQLPGTYFQDLHSQWIWADASGVGGGENATYTFRLTFDLTGFDPATVKIEGDWGVDNDGQILLNGSPKVAALKGSELVLSHGATSNYTQFHHFSIAGGFVAGLNTLDFVVTNIDGPGALNVTNLKGAATASDVSAVPEPSSMVLSAVGAVCAMAGFARWQRNPSAAQRSQL